MPYRGNRTKTRRRGTIPPIMAYSARYARHSASSNVLFVVHPFHPFFHRLTKQESITGSQLENIAQEIKSAGEAQKKGLKPEAADAQTYLGSIEKSKSNITYAYWKGKGEKFFDYITRLDAAVRSANPDELRVILVEIPEFFWLLSKYWVKDRLMSDAILTLPEDGYPVQHHKPKLEAICGAAKTAYFAGSYAEGCVPQFASAAREFLEEEQIRPVKDLMYYEWSGDNPNLCFFENWGKGAKLWKAGELAVTSNELPLI